jgi:hypothetical protein
VPEALISRYQLKIDKKIGVGHPAGRTADYWFGVWNAYLESI